MSLTKSKIFLYFCSSFILGVAFASFIFLPFFLNGLFFIFACLAIMIFWQRKKTMVVFGFCLIFCLSGVLRYQAKTLVNQNDISQFNDQGRLTFVGTIQREPDQRPDKTMFVVKASEVSILGVWQKASGYVLLNVNKYPQYQYGDKIKITGQVQTPTNFESFDYQQYLAKDDMYSVLYYPEIELLAQHQESFVKEKLFWLKNKLEQGLSQILSEPQFSLASGLIFGEKTALPPDFKNALNVVGLTHIVALSGFNITIIAETLRRFLNSLAISRHYSFWLSVFFIIGFVLMTGAAPSLVRAAVMGILLLLAQKTGRLYQIRNALIFAGVLMLMFNPKILRFDVGFQMSFLATLGLVYISPLLEKYFNWLPKIFALPGLAAATLGAQLAVLPLILFNFGRLSLIAPLANLLILPIIPLTMFWSFLSSVLSVFWSGLGQVVAWLAWLFLTYQIKIVQWLGSLPYASLNIKINWLWLVIFYCILGLALIKLRKRDSYDFGKQ